MKKNIPTPLADEYLESIKDIRDAETDPFFYTRLKARMEKETISGWNFPLKPAWLVSMLIVFLFVNSFFLVSQVMQNRNSVTKGSSLQTFASSYDLSVSTPF